MADVTIDGTISTSTARGMRSLAFKSTDDQIGYRFYIESGTGAFVYSKTTDGGATWGAAVTIKSAASQVAYDTWPEWYTPGDSGTKILLTYFDVTNDKVFFNTIDVASDTLGTERTVLTGASAVAGRGAFCSITKTRSGYIYIAYDIDAGAEKGLHRSTDGGTTWSASLLSTFIEATVDQCFLFPASGTGDDNDCWALYQDASVNAITLKMWDSSAAAQVESATIATHGESTGDLTGQYGFNATVRHSDGHLLMASRVAGLGAAGAFEFYDIASTSSWTKKTNLVGSIDDNWYPSVFIDQGTGDIYVAYIGALDNSEAVGITAAVHYVKSTDGGTTWGAEQAYQQSADNTAQQTWAPLMGPRFYVSWRVGSTLIGNAANSLTFSAGGANTPVSLSATSSFSPAIASQKAYSRSLAVALTAAVVIARVVAFFRTLSVSATLSPVVGRVASFVRTLGASSSFGTLIVKAKPLTLAVSSTFTSSISRALGFGRTLAANATLSPVIARAVAYRKSMAATSTFTPLVSRIAVYLRGVSAASTFTPLVIAGRGSFRTLAATTTATVAISSRFILGKALSVSSSFAAAVTKLPARFRSLAVASPFAISLARPASFLRSLSVSTVATVQLRKGMARSLAISSSFVAGLVRAPSIGRVLAVASPFVPSVARSAVRRIALAVAGAFTAALQWLIAGFDTEALTGETRVYPKLTGATRAYPRLAGEARARVLLTGTAVAFTALDGEVRAAPAMTGEVRIYPKAA